MGRNRKNRGERKNQVLLRPFNMREKMISANTNGFFPKRTEPSRENILTMKACEHLTAWEPNKYQSVTLPALLRNGLALSLLRNRLKSRKRKVRRRGNVV